MQPNHDNPREPTYDALMAGAQAYIDVTIDTKNPVELGDFVSEFTSVSAQYDKFMRENHPDLSPGAQMFVKQVRPGSIIFELLPYAPNLLLGPDVVSTVDSVNAVVEFVREYGEKLQVYLGRGRTSAATSRSDLNDFMGQVAAIARDPNAKAAIEAVVFEDGKKKIRAAIKFDTPQAVHAVQKIEAHKKRLEATDSADHSRVLMVFTQTNVRTPQIGKRTGEWVQIETISPKDLPVIYASELAEQRIKHEITEDETNVYKKGFVVDVNVETRGGRPVAYRVTNLHQVIELPDDDD